MRRQKSTSPRAELLKVIKNQGLRNFNQPVFIKIPGEKRGEATNDKSPDFPVVRHSKDVRKRTVLNFLYSGFLSVRPCVCLSPLCWSYVCTYHCRISIYWSWMDWMVENGCMCVQCAVCVWSSLMRRNTDHRSIWTTEQEQSSLYIVQNKLLISSSDSVETKEASDLFMRFWLRFNSWRSIKS